jgi:hypothetical protein
MDPRLAIRDAVKATPIFGLYNSLCIYLEKDNGVQVGSEQDDSFQFRQQ